MKGRLLIAGLLLTAVAGAEEAASVNESNWPTLDKFWPDQQDPDSFIEALVKGTPSAELKFGYEYADLDGNGLDPANALIGRIRANYQTGIWMGFDGFVQAQYVGPLVDDYSDGVHDPVADPEAFRFHQLYLGWSGYDTKARIGAQEIILDNARFIGNVGWRFNAQSFNAGLIQNQSIENLKLFYAYTDSINAPDGETDRDRQYHLANIQYDLGENNSLSGYGYFQRNDMTPNIETYGLRFWGKNGKIAHNAMLAFQRDAYYGYLSGTAKLDAFDLELGGEYISGGLDERKQFQTLNGTAHAFNGWADQFLGTGGGLTTGLIDLWAKAAYKPMDQMSLAAIYHYFNTASDAAGFSGMIGQEIDAELKYAFNAYIDTSATVAYYMKGDDALTNLTADETVFWLRAAFKF